VLELLVHRGTVFLVTMGASGERMRPAAGEPELAEWARRLHSDLRVMTNPLVPRALRDVAARSFATGAAWVDDHLLADVPPGAELHVVGPGQVITLPWGALPSRRGAVTAVSPHLTRVGAGRPVVRPAGQEERSVSCLAGPGVPQGGVEVAEVAALWPGASALTGSDATCEAATRALRSSDVVHLATHGTHVVENALFSSVRLADGPLFAYELDGMRLSPSLVVLSSCDVGQATPAPGGQTLGFADALAASVMPRLHALVRAGQAPARALAQVTAEVEEPVPFVCFTSTLD